MLWRRVGSLLGIRLLGRMMGTEQEGPLS